MSFGVDGIALFVFGLPVWVVYRIITRITKKTDVGWIQKEIIYGVFFLYALSVCSLTLFPFYINSYMPLKNRMHGNFIPFINTIRDITRSSNSQFMQLFWVKNILGNLIVLLPLGILLPLVQKKYDNVLKATLFGFFISFSIELIQFVSTFFGNSGRVFDIDDIIFNVFGVFLGAIIYKKLCHKFNIVKTEHSA